MVILHIHLRGSRIRTPLYDRPDFMPQMRLGFPVFSTWHCTWAVAGRCIATDCYWMLKVHFFYYFSGSQLNLLTETFFCVLSLSLPALACARRWLDSMLFSLYSCVYRAIDVADKVLLSLHSRLQFALSNWARATSLCLHTVRSGAWHNIFFSDRSLPTDLLMNCKPLKYHFPGGRLTNEAMPCAQPHSHQHRPRARPPFLGLATNMMDLNRCTTPATVVRCCVA